MVKKKQALSPATDLYTPQLLDIIEGHLSNIMPLLDICCNFRIFCSLPLIAASLMSRCWGSREKAARASSKGSARPPTASCLCPVPLGTVVLTLATHWTYPGSFKKKILLPYPCPRESLIQKHTRTENSYPGERWSLLGRAFQLHKSQKIPLPWCWRSWTSVLKYGPHPSHLGICLK